jgi:glycosyltransferase involved in cell wall biosynthesis
MTLSVVLIARNQERSVGPLIESVLRETADLALKELLLVDSASTDRTVEVALGYPVSVLALPQADWLCAAAGRYVGYANTTGDSVLFLDGDMELCAGWLPRAIAVLETEPALAAVAGRVIDSETQAAELPTDPVGEATLGAERGWEVPHPAGAGLYRRAALEEVGSFNPYLRSDEEPELALRLRARGYRIFSLDAPSVIHHQPVAGGFPALFARRQRGLFVGHGQVARALVGTPALPRFLRERGYFIAPLLAGLLGGVATAASLAQRRPRWFLAWAGLVLSVLGADAVRRRSVRATGLAALNRVFFLEGLLRGFWGKPGIVAEHPALNAVRWARAPEASPRAASDSPEPRVSG